MSVKSKEVNTLTKNDINVDIESSEYKVLEMFQPIKSKETKFIEGSPDEITAQLIDVIKNKIKVI